MSVPGGDDNLSSAITIPESGNFLDLKVLKFLSSNIYALDSLTLFSGKKTYSIFLSIEKIADSWAFLPYAHIDKIIFYFRKKSNLVPGIPCFPSQLPAVSILPENYLPSKSG